jgi:hypothetical protein
MPPENFSEVHFVNRKKKKKMFQNYKKIEHRVERWLDRVQPAGNKLRTENK